MRELTATEVMAVSGSGVIQDMTTNLGKQVGFLIGNTLGSLIPIPAISGIIASYANTLFSDIGGWLGGLVGRLIEGQNISAN